MPAARRGSAGGDLRLLGALRTARLATFFEQELGEVRRGGRGRGDEAGPPAHVRLGAVRGVGLFGVPDLQQPQLLRCSGQPGELVLPAAALGSARLGEVDCRGGDLLEAFGGDGDAAVDDDESHLVCSLDQALRLVGGRAAEVHVMVQVVVQVVVEVAGCAAEG